MNVTATVKRMRAWAEANPWADTQGLMDDEWEALARSALGLPTKCSTCERESVRLHGDFHVCQSCFDELMGERR